MVYKSQTSIVVVRTIAEVTLEEARVALDAIGDPELLSPVV